jgi:hypothetical protein
MLRVLAVLLALCGVAHSEEGGPGESEGKAEAAQTDNQHGGTPKQITVPANSPAPTIININTGKHSGEESHCAQPKDWKEWGSFAWCRSLEWIDAERIIAIWTVVLGIATCILGVATVKPWRATDRLVKGAEETAQRQLRAYVSVTRVEAVVLCHAIGGPIELTQRVILEKLRSNPGRSDGGLHRDNNPRWRGWRWRPYQSSLPRNHAGDRIGDRENDRHGY